jgi:hypothetical protein
MRKLLTFLIALGAVVFAVYSPAFAPVNAQMTMTGAGSTKVSVAPPYQGPGDVFSGAIVFYSSARAYNAAYATGTNPCMDLVDQAAANAITINILSTGFVDVASINAWVTAHSVTTIEVTRVYDQTGNGHHEVQATLANMPTLTLNAINGLPAITNTLSILRMDSATAITQAQPLTMMGVAKRATNTNQGAFLGNSSAVTPWIGSHNTTQFEYSAGTSQDTIITSAQVWSGYSILMNGASSFTNVNGTDAATPGSPGTGGWTAQGVRFMQSGGVWDGQVAEAGIWPTSTSTNRNALYANQHSFSGYNGAF